MNDTSKMNSTYSKSPVCVTSGDYSVNHLDHLSVVAYMLDAPLISDTPFLHQMIETYYPQIKPLYIEFHQQILEELGQNYDQVFFSIGNFRKDLDPLVKLFYGKKLEFWYCPHGNSDKTLEHFALQQSAFIYGDQMRERLVQEGFMDHLERVIETGNLRQSFYSAHKEFQDGIAQKELFSKFAKEQTTILYAPTWHDLEQSSSLFTASMPLIDQLPDSFNLIVKMHPWLEHHQPGHVNLIREKYHDRPNIVVLSEFPYVWPILDRTDLYIGDFSSIGYDFLFYDRPMFFFDPKDRKRKRSNDSLLHSCGDVISSHENIFPFIDAKLKNQARFSKKRKELYTYAFGNPRPFDEIRSQVGATAPSSPGPHQT